MAFNYRYGERQIVELPLDADTDAVTVGMAATYTGATAGYIQNVDGSGDVVHGFFVDRASSPSADGGISALVDISELAVYECPPDAGTVTQGLVGLTCDVGADGLSANIDASSTDDLFIVDVDTTANTLFVKLLRKPGGVA